MKNILTESLEDFTKYIAGIESKTLVRLIKEIYEFKWERGNTLSLDAMKDLERKETRINRELQARKYLNEKQYHDYFSWLKSMNFKKKVY